PRCASLPSDVGPKGLTTYQGDSVKFRIDSSLAAALRRAAQFHGTSLYGVVLSCIYVLVFRYTNQEDIVIGTQSSGRGHAQLEPQVGCFVNTLALRGSITGSDRAAEVIQRVGGILSEALRHQMYPFDKVVECLKRSQVLPSSPLFAIQVDYAPELASENNSIASFSARELIERRRTTKHPISFLIEESRAADESGGNRLTVEIVYSTELYARQSILVLSDRLLSILRAFSEDDARSIESIDLSAGPNPAKNAGASRRVKVELNIAD
ncbi:MAG: condensation domain-containing protein, partial [Blastocatellia bacterium]